MPRIDPLQLLKCLSVLLTPEGGILSRDEVPRLVNLMTKFSKKLVSKCVYVLILKNTSTELVDMFMAEGGWALIQTWLQDAVLSANWHLVKEILGLLLITPVDVERLKLNILPKLIKSLSRRDEVEDIAELSTQLVKQWLTIVKGSSGVAQQPIDKLEVVKPLNAINETVELSENKFEAISTSAFYKKDSKEVTDELESVKKEMSPEKVKHKEEEKKSSSRSSRSSSKSNSRDKERSKEKDRERDRQHEKDRRVSSSSSSKSIKSSRDKDRKDRDKDRKDRDKDRKDRDKDRERDRHKDKNRDKDKDKDKSKYNGYLKSSSSRDKKEYNDKKDKEKSDKTKNNLDAFKPPSVEKLGRIPKKSNSAETKETKESLENKKKSFSVGIRKDKDSEERPKTVKVYNSKMRSTGLEEEAKPAPSRLVKKSTPSAPLPPISLKRTSPLKDIIGPVVPPEKKIKIDKIDIPERPGSIKLIPPKPKPMLQESDLFNDALTAATSKKEPKKRKRRASTSKDAPSSPLASPAHDQPSTPTTTVPPAGSPLGLKNIAPINFYQDTLSEDAKEEQTNDENKENDKTENLDDSTASTVSDTKEIRSPRAVTPTEDDPEEIKKLKLDGGIKGVLLYTRKKGPKKTISWKNETDLVEIRYFELDETERVNVTKAFNDMAKMDISNEREALQLSRKVGGEDLMEAQIVWRIPFEIDLVESLTVVHGHRSLEKDIQFAREKSVLQALYFDKRKIPDSPEEPIPENHQMSDPVVIALEDPESQEYDLRSTPWPEPKGNQPLPEPQIPMIFPSIQTSFPQTFNNMPPPNFPNLPPRFPVPNGPIIPPGPNNFGPPNMMPNGNMMPSGNMMGGPPNVLPPNDLMMTQMNPNMFPGGPMPDNFGPEPDFGMYGNPNGPGPGTNMNMFPPNNFNNHRHNNRGGGFRRGGRGGSDGNWVRMNGPGGGNWRRGGGGNRGGRLCKHVQNHGFCRNRDTCPFIHP